MTKAAETPLATTLLIRKLRPESAEAIERFKSFNHNANVNTTAAMQMIEEYWWLKEEIQKLEQDLRLTRQNYDRLCSAISRINRDQQIVNDLLSDWQD